MNQSVAIPAVASVSETRLPPFYQTLHNGVVLAQAVLVLLASVLPASGSPVILDRAMDLMFAGYLGLILMKCLLQRPSIRLLLGLSLIGAYGMTGLLESYLNHNLGGFMYEAKLIFSAVLFFCLLDERPTISDRSVKILFVSFIIASCIFVALNHGTRLHLINESNYLCMYVGIAMFSYMSNRSQKITPKVLVGLAFFTVFLIVTTQSRTGAGFLALAWLVYFRERFGNFLAILLGVVMGLVGAVGSAVAIAADAPIVKRFEEFKDPSRVDRMIYLVEAKKIIERRDLNENLIRFAYAEPVSTRVADDMKWLSSKHRSGMEQGQLYPHHFHLAYLRILLGHGFLPLLCFLIMIPVVWRHNRYLGLGLAICSISMSVPYLSLFFGALQFAMAFPNSKTSTTHDLPSA